MGERTSDFYVLCRLDFGDGGQVYTHISTKPSPNDLSEEIKRQVRGGVPSSRLVVFKTIPFDVKIGVMFKEEN